MTRSVVVLGAGTGGTMVANLLQRRDPDLDITVVGEGDAHVFQPANLDVAFKGAPPKRSVHREAPLLRPLVRFVPTGATRVDLAKRRVHLKDGRGLRYDALVLATGSVADPSAMPGLAEAALDLHTGPERARRIWDALQRFERGRVVVAIAGVPYKCPPSPVEAVFLLDEHFRRRGLRHAVDIRLVTPYPRAYPAAAIAEVVEPRLAQQGIGVTTLFNMEAVDPAKRVITSLEGEEAPYDLLIAVPPHHGAEVVRASGLGDADGWIPTDKETMRVKGQRGVYALGDATDIPISKSGVVAHLQADVVADNLLHELRGEPVERAFEGRINCPMEVGGARALFVSATYAKPPAPQRPNRLRYAMKKGFGKAYWRVLGGGLEPVFRMYFGPTAQERRT